MNAGFFPLVASPPIIRSRFDPIFANRDFGIRGLGHEPENDQFQRFLDEASNRKAVVESALMNIVYTGQLYVREKTKLYGNGATLTAHPATSSATTGLHLTDSTWAGIGPADVLIDDLRVNGNATARRASGALTGIGQAAAVYCIGTLNLRLLNLWITDSSGDGIYIGGNGSTGRLSQYFSVRDCFVQTPSRNCYSLVGTANGLYDNCVGLNATYGHANGNISYAWDYEPDGATTLNQSVDCVSCKALYCTTTGFGVNTTLGDSANCNWVSCYAEGNGVAFYASAGGSGVRVIGGRLNGNTTSFTNLTEKIASFP